MLASGVVLLGAMAFDTTIVKIGSDRDVQVQKFSPEAFGAEQFPVVRQSVETRAVDAVELSKAIVADKKTDRDLRCCDLSRSGHTGQVHWARWRAQGQL